MTRKTNTKLNITVYISEWDQLSSGNVLSRHLLLVRFGHVMITMILVLKSGFGLEGAYKEVHEPASNTSDM